jgi:hypothetical protein
VTIERNPPPDGVEVLMLAGAWLAPFNFVLGVSVGGLSLRPLHLWAVAMLLVLIATGRDRLIAAIDWPVLAFWTTFAFIVLSTLFATPAEYKFRGLADVGLLSLNVVGFTVMRGYYATRPDAWLRFFKSLAMSSVLMSIALTIRAVTVGNAGRVAGVDSFALGLGTIAGTYTAGFAAAAAAAIVFATTRRQLVAALIAFIVHGNAMVLSLARGPWLAFAVAIATTIPLAAWRFGSRFSVGRTAVRGVATLLALPLFFRIAIAYNPFIRDLLVQRVVQVVNLESGSGSSRLIVWQAFFHDAGRSPVFGRGAAAYREISERLGTQGSVSENFGVEILHAGGVVAVTFFVLGLIGVAFHCLLKPGAARSPVFTAACLTGATAMVIASMTNPAAWNGLFWIVLGLAATRPVTATTAATRLPTLPP